MMPFLIAWISIGVVAKMITKATEYKINHMLKEKGYQAREIMMHLPFACYLFAPVGLYYAIDQYKKIEQNVEKIINQFDQQEEKKASYVVTNQQTEEIKLTPTSQKILVVKHCGEKEEDSICYIVQDNTPIIVKSTGVFDKLSRKEQYDRIEKSYQQLQQETEKYIPLASLSEMLNPEKPIYNIAGLLEKENVQPIEEQVLLETYRQTALLLREIKRNHEEKNSNTRTYTKKK